MMSLKVVFEASRLVVFREVVCLTTRCEVGGLGALASRAFFLARGESPEVLFLAKLTAAFFASYSTKHLVV